MLRDRFVYSVNFGGHSSARLGELAFLIRAKLADWCAEQRVLLEKGEHRSVQMAQAAYAPPLKVEKKSNDADLHWPIAIPPNRYHPRVSRRHDERNFLANPPPTATEVGNEG